MHVEAEHGLAILVHRRQRRLCGPRRDLVRDPHIASAGEIASGQGAASVGEVDLGPTKGCVDLDIRGCEKLLKWKENKENNTGSCAYKHDNLYVFVFAADHDV